MYNLYETLRKHIGKNTYFNCSGTKTLTFEKLSQVISYIEKYSGNDLLKFHGAGHKEKFINININKEYSYNFIIEYIEK